jgi:hypothetical protein
MRRSRLGVTLLLTALIGFTIVRLTERDDSASQPPADKAASEERNDSAPTASSDPRIQQIQKKRAVALRPVDLVEP